MVQRKGLYQNGVVPATKILQSYKTGNSVSYKALPPDRDKNPAFDPRIRRTNNAGGLASHGLHGLLRGRIIQYRKERYPMKPGVPKKQRAVNFLYNPEQIAINYSFDPSAYPAESQQQQYDVPVLGATGQTISWTLYFNRMYEVASDHRQENMGVLADVQAIEYLMGSTDGQTKSMVECMVVFGATPRQKPFAFIGYLSDVNVSYLHFSRRMIPTTAKVEVGMVRRFIANDTGAQAGEIANSVAESLNDPTTPITGGAIPEVVNPNDPYWRSNAPDRIDSRATNTGRIGGVPIK